MSEPITTQIELPGLQYLRFERAATDEEHAEFLADSARQIDEALAMPDNEGRIVMILDAANTSSGTSAQRKAQAEFQKTYEAYFRKHVVCAVFVAESMILRGVLTAIAWVSPFPYPVEVTKDIESGIRIALEKLEEAGVAERPSPVDLAKIRVLYREDAP